MKIGRKKNLMVGVRIDETLKERLDIFESFTGIPPAQLARSSLEAALDFFEQKRSITFPLVCMSQDDFESTVADTWSESRDLALKDAKSESGKK